MVVMLAIGVLGILEQLFLFALTGRGFSDVALGTFGTLVTTATAGLFQLLRYVDRDTPPPSGDRPTPSPPPEAPLPLLEGTSPEEIDEAREFLADWLRETGTPGPSSGASSVEER